MKMSWRNRYRGVLMGSKASDTNLDLQNKSKPETFVIAEKRVSGDFHHLAPWPKADSNHSDSKYLNIGYAASPNHSPLSQRSSRLFRKSSNGSSYSSSERQHDSKYKEWGDRRRDSKSARRDSAFVEREHPNEKTDAKKEKHFVDVMTSFADKTSFQALPYIRSSGHWYTKALWISVFACALGAWIFHSFYLAQSYLAYGTTSTVSISYDTLDFPSVTICNINPIRQRMLDEGYGSEELVSFFDDLKPASTYVSMLPSERNQQQQQPNQQQNQPGEQQPNQNQQGEQQPNQNQQSEQQPNEQGQGQQQPNRRKRQLGERPQNENPPRVTSNQGQSDNSVTEAMSMQTTTSPVIDNTVRNKQSKLLSTTMSSTNTDFLMQNTGSSLLTSTSNSPSIAMVIPTTYSYNNDTALDSNTNQTNQNPNLNQNSNVTENTNVNPPQQNSYPTQTHSITTSPTIITQPTQSSSATENADNNQNENPTKNPNSNQGNQNPTQNSNENQPNPNPNEPTDQRPAQPNNNPQSTNSNQLYQNIQQLDSNQFGSGNTSAYLTAEADFKLLYANIPLENRTLMAHQAQSMILQCSFNGKECSYENFTHYTSLDYGNCYTFNSAADRNVSLKSERSGPLYGLDLTMYIEEHEYISGFRGGRGLRVAVHTYNTLSNVREDSLSLPPGFHTYAGMRMIDATRLGGKFGACDDDGSFKNYFKTTYTKQACMDTCVDRTVLEQCLCLTLNHNENHVGDTNSLPRCFKDVNDSVACEQYYQNQFVIGTLNCSCNQECDLFSYGQHYGGSTHPQHHLYCKETSLFWRRLKDWMISNLKYGFELTVREILFGIPMNNNYDDSRLLILFGKWSIGYDMLMSYNRWPHGSIFYSLVDLLCNGADETQCEYIRALDLDAGGISVFLKENFLRLSLYYRDLNFEMVEQQEEYPTSQFISDFGGCIGLWVGASAITAIELLDLSFRCCGFFCCSKRTIGNDQGNDVKDKKRNKGRKQRSPSKSYDQKWSSNESRENHHLRRTPFANYA